MNRTQELIVLAVIGFLLVLYFNARVPKVEDQKWDTCVGLAIEVIPDPNDLTERSEFIKNCYEA